MKEVASEEAIGLWMSPPGPSVSFWARHALLVSQRYHPGTCEISIFAPGCVDNKMLGISL